MVGGADYASSDKNKAGSKADTDYFALAYVAKHPLGGAVFYSGVLERTTLFPALGYVEKAQAMFPGWQTCIVEGDGKGWEFIQTLMLKPGLLVNQMKTGGKTKPDRLEKQMGPMLESGRVKISDADTPFLNELRKELREWPENSHDDAMDAVYWALRGMPDALVMPAISEELPTMHKQKLPNPFLSFGG
jgi:phage terminase large subunit-like protein